MSPQCRLAVVTLVFGLAVGCGKKQSVADAPGPLSVGVGQALIGLPIGIGTAGYSQSPLLGSPLPKDEPGSPYADMFPATRAMESPPMAKAIVLDNGGSRVIIAKIDAVGVTNVLTERVIQLAAQMIPGSDGDIAGKLILNGSHTHDAGCRFSRASAHPDLLSSLSASDPRSNTLAYGFDTYSQEATDDVAKAVVQAIVGGLGTMKPATFGYASGTNELAAQDRRCENNHLTNPTTDYGGYGADYHDPRVVVMRFDDAATGDPIAVLFNYAMHGTIYDAANRSISTDAPGHAEYELESLFQKPIVAMYIQGNAADTGPSYGQTTGSQAMQYAGWQLAQTVKSLYDGVSNATSTLPLQVAERWVPISYAGLGYAKGEFFPDGAVLCFEANGNYTCPPGGTHTPADIIDPTQSICFSTVVPGEGMYATRFAAARIGDLGLAAIPGEPATKVGELIVNQMKTMPGIKDAAIIGYAQDHNGYILMDDDWLSGGYNPTISFWGWKFGAYAVQQGVDVFQELVTGKANHKNPPPTKPNLAPDVYTPIVPSDSMMPAAIDADVLAPVERMDVVDFSFYGGDPGLGMPAITLQAQGSDGGFADVKRNGWIPVTNLHGDDFAVFYSASPTFKATPSATSRVHHWEAKYEPPIDLPTGAYRVHVVGQQKTNGGIAQYELYTSTFQIVASTKLTIAAQLAVSNGTVVFDGILLYPQRAPVFDPEADDAAWQTDNFRLAVPRFGGQFAPAVPATTLPVGTLTPDVGNALPATLTYVTGPAVPDTAASYLPGQGPGLHAAIPVTNGTTFTLAIPLVTDQYGNTSAPTTVSTQ
jgi:neutral ceramidase